MTDDEREAAIEAEIAKIQAAISAVAILRNPEHADDPPYVQAWAIAAEWTNIDLDREDRYGTVKIYPTGQLASTTRGLGDFLRK